MFPIGVMPLKYTLEINGVNLLSSLFSFSSERFILRISTFLSLTYLNSPNPACPPEVSLKLAASPEFAVFKGLKFCWSYSFTTKEPFKQQTSLVLKNFLYRKIIHVGKRGKNSFLLTQKGSMLKSNKYVLLYLYPLFLKYSLLPFDSDCNPACPLGFSSSGAFCSVFYLLPPICPPTHPPSFLAWK